MNIYLFNTNAGSPIGFWRTTG